MSHIRSVTEVSRHFAEYINRVLYRGERFVLVRGKQPVAELTPVPVGGRLAELPELLASLPRLSDADAFASDLAEGRGALSAAPVWDAWAS